jgi:hypothetical protein
VCALTGVPRRTTAIWVALMAATCATWWLGTGHFGAREHVLLAVVATIVIAFVKIAFVGFEFMELRKAPLILRTAFLLWVAGVASATAALFAI